MWMIFSTVHEQNVKAATVHRFPLVDWLFDLSQVSEELPSQLPTLLPALFDPNIWEAQIHLVRVMRRCCQHPVHTLTPHPVPARHSAKPGVRDT